MIIRNSLKCSACNNTITTRTAIGHGSYQEFAFPCPECGIEIRFGMEIDHKKPDYKYTKIINAKWTESNSPTDELDFSMESTVVLDAENLVPISGQHFSPFQATVFLAKEPLIFHRHQSVRLHASQKIWSEIEKLIIHETNRNEELFDKQRIALGYSDNCQSWSERILLTIRILHDYGNFYSCEPKGQNALINQRISLSESISSTLIGELINYLNTPEACRNVFEEMLSIRKRWSNLYPMLSPIYNIFYWNDDTNSLDDYTLAQKRFEDLKPFFIDCFETLCRISVIAAAIEGIIFHKSLGVPASSGLLKLEKFNEMPNGSKPDILNKLVVGDLFVPYINSRLRNGLGHHSAKYDVNHDVIEYIYKAKDGAHHEILSYIRFCEKVVRMYSQLELVSIYAHWLRIRAEEIEDKIY